MPDPNHSLIGDPYLNIDTRFYPEFKDRGSEDILREKLFLISKTLEGNSWNDLLGLSDRERNWLYNRCVEYHKKQEEEMRKANRKRK